MIETSSAEAKVREIRGKICRCFSSEEKIRIVLEGLRGEESIAELCRREGISPNLCYSIKATPRFVHKGDTYSHALLHPVPSAPRDADPGYDVGLWAMTCGSTP